MKINPTIILVFFLVFLLFVVIVVQIYITPKTPTNNTGNLSLSERIKILATDIPQEAIEVGQPLKIIFDKPLSNNQLLIELDPPTPFDLSLDNSKKEVIISPTDAWSFNTKYTLKISKEKNNFIDKEYIFTFTTQLYGGI